MSNITHSNEMTLPDVAGDEGLFVDGDWIESKDQDPNGEVRLIQMMDIGDGEYLNKSSRFLTTETANRLRCTFLEAGDVLISRMPDPLGRACIFPGDSRPCVTAVDVCILRPNDNKADRRWLKYFINSPSFRSEISRWATGTTRSRISRGNLGKIPFLLPPLSEQKRIADILDKSDAIRRKRQEAVSVHGTLGASAFLEFFGDPLTNPQGWKLETLETVSSQDGRGLKRGPFGGALKKEIFVDQGFKVYEQKHAIADDFTIGSYYIDDDKFDEMEAFSVRPDDLIVSCSGTMGRVAIVPESAEPGIINQALLRISPDTSKVSSLYLKMLLETTPVQRHLYGFSRGSGLKNFPPMSEVRALPVPIPSQERLAAFHEYMGQTTCAGEKIRRAEKTTDVLFNSLVQRAFKGEL